MKNELDEKMLIYRVEATRDPEAFSALYSHYYPAIYRFILFRVSNPDVAHDVVADVFLKLWTHVIERRRLTNFRALAYRIARNTVVDHYRAARPTISLDEMGALEPMTEDFAALAGGAIDRSIAAEKLAQALHVLKEEDIELVTLFYAEHLRVKEIATIVNKRPGTIRVQLHRALKQLRDVL